MLLQVIILIAGLALLVKGADWLVEGASTLAKKRNISNLAIGLTIVAFGTSAPELVVNVIASIQKHEDIVFGNVIGSNNFNLFAILGIAGIISPLIVQSSTVKKEIPISLLAAVVLFILANDFLTGGEKMLSRIDGLILLAFFGCFLYYVYLQMKSTPEKVATPTGTPTMSTSRIWFFVIIGLAGLVIGGRMVVTSAMEMATVLGLSEKVIGLTIVAAGTSLPELATSVVAALKKNNDIAVGNIIGSNIFNIFFILGLSTVIQPMGYNQIFNFDLYFLAVGTVVLLLAMFTGHLKRLDRWEAAILLLAYIGYTAYLVWKEM